MRAAANCQPARCHHCHSWHLLRPDAVLYCAWVKCVPPPHTRMGSYLRWADHTSQGKTLLAAYAVGGPDAAMDLIIEWGPPAYLAWTSHGW